MEKSKGILIDFLRLKNFKKLDELAGYDFHEIYQNKDLKKFDNNKTYEDGDCTKLAYAIDWIVWRKELKSIIPNYSEDDLFQEINFSGDTICTFNTLFGSTCELFSTVVTQLKIENTEIKQKIEQFRQKYQTIGNFSLLPNKSIDGQTLNKYRGRYWGWKDYFDIFLLELNKALHRECENIDFCEIVKENDFFFSKIKTVKNYCNMFFIDDTFSLSGVHFNHNMLNDYNIDSYKNFINEYITKSINLIDVRSRKILTKLKEELKNTDFPKEYLD